MPKENKMNLSEQILNLVHAFSDEDRKESVRKLANEVSQLESEKAFLQSKVGEISKMQPSIDREKIAELQRVVQVKDEALQFYADPGQYHAILVVGDPPCGGFVDDFDSAHGDPLYDRPMPGKTARKALECTPSNLPKFVTEEEHLKEVVSLQNQLIESEGRHYCLEREYLRVKERFDFFDQIHIQSIKATSEYIIQFDLLKSHAETMAERISSDISDKAPELKVYRKDFPKGGANELP